jgi:P27 family predicted phage terminase small subunit
VVMPRKSEKEHWLEGTKAHTGPRPSEFAGGRPRVPKNLSPVARKAYKRAVQLLENRRTLTPSDETTLEIYARTYALWVHASEQLGDKLIVETTVLDSNGAPHTVKKVNQLLKIVDSLTARVHALAKSLGLTQVDLNRCKPVAAVGDSQRTDEQLADEKLRDWFNRPKELSVPPLQFVPVAPPATPEDEDE